MLQFVQSAARPMNDLRIVETLDEFQSITTGYGKSSNLKYKTYYDVLINACVGYDRTKWPTWEKEATLIKLQHTLRMMDLIMRAPIELHGEIHLRVWTP